MNTEEFVERLMEKDGVENVGVKVEVTATVRRRATGEVDKFHQEVRERVVEEKEMASLVRDTGWLYSGCVDVVGDFYLKDRFRKRYKKE